jgi:4-amino-4-deoxy-L-arabinose transferase-like glycosyltransferase
VAALAGTIVVLRSAGFAFGLLNIDESDFALIAKRILQGAVPYAQIADIKPPLAYLAFAPAALFGRLSIFPVHVLGVLWMLATCLVLGRAARRLTGNALAAACAPWLALLAGQCDVPSVSTELLMALPLAGALLFYVRAETGGSVADQGLAGLCIGIASLFRHQAGILLAAFGLALCWQMLRERSLQGLVRPIALTLGFALPWVAVAGAFTAAGGFSEFWDWVVTRNLHYLPAGTTGDTLLRAAQAIPLCVGSAIVPWVLATRETFRPTVQGPARTGVVLSVWLSWIAVGMGGRFYEHYFLQFLAPLALLASPGAAELVKSWPGWSRGRRRMVVLACALPALILLAFSFARGLAGAYPEQEPRARELASWLRANTAPEERLFIWGHYSPIYYLAGRLPGTRYLTTSVHVGNFDPGHLADGVDLTPFRSDRDVALTVRDLEANRVPVFVDTAPSGIHHWDRVPLSTVPALERFLHEHYALVAEVAGSRIYRRRQGVTAAQP